MDREQMKRCLEVVAAYRASGLKGKEWAQAKGVCERVLPSWCAHSRRWQARLDGVSDAASPQGAAKGFAAARLAPAAARTTTVHVQVNAGAARLDLHWPLAHSGELAGLLRELGR